MALWRLMLGLPSRNGTPLWAACCLLAGPAISALQAIRVSRRYLPSCLLWTNTSYQRLESSKPSACCGGRETLRPRPKRWSPTAPAARLAAERRRLCRLPTAAERQLTNQRQRAPATHARLRGDQLNHYEQDVQRNDCRAASSAHSVWEPQERDGRGRDCRQQRQVKPVGR